MDGESQSPLHVIELRPRSVARLAELVADLSGCPAPAALDAVSRAGGEFPPATADEALAVVARAMVQMRHRVDVREH